jgi:hypothetical protein
VVRVPPTETADRDLLLEDTPAQAAADLEMLERWDRTHPQALTPEGGARDRIAAKLEAMARWMETQP